MGMTNIFCLGNDNGQTHFTIRRFFGTQREYIGDVLFSLPQPFRVIEIFG